MMRFGYAAALISILGCSEAPLAVNAVARPDSAAEPTIAPPDVSGSYALVLVNGVPLPSKSPTGVGEWDYDGATYELVRATLTLNRDGTYVEAWVHRRTGTSQLFSQEFTGKYIHISKSVLRLGTAATVARLTGTALIWQLSKFRLTYELSK
jgi:hypothetical protein